MLAKKRILKKNTGFSNNIKKTIEIVVIIIAILIILLLIVKNFEMIGRKAQLETNVLKLTDEIKKLEYQKASLQIQFSDTQKDIFIEKQAREKLNLQKQGEQAVVIEGLEFESVSADKNQDQGIFQKIKDIFK